MKVLLVLILLGTSLFSCDPRSKRSRSIPLQKLEKEIFSTVDTTFKDSVDKIIEE